MKRFGFKGILLLILSVSLTLLAIALPALPISAAVSWNAYEGDLVLDSEYISNAWVIKNDPGDYEMWYVHVKTTLSLEDILDGVSNLISQDIFNAIANLDLEVLLNSLAGLDSATVWSLLGGSNSVIGYATSADGVNWVVQEDEVIGLSAGNTIWDGISAPCVVKTGSDYEMWYTHSLTSFTQEDLADILIALGDSETRKSAILALLDSTQTVIGYATSTDGADWTPIASNIVPVTGDGGIWEGVASPCVVKNSDTDYQMWFTNYSTAFSDSNLDSLLADLGAFNTDALFSILDETSSSINYVTSSDGIDWDDSPPITVLSGSSGGIWDSVATPSVVKTASDSYEMWFTQAITNLSSESFPTFFTELNNLESDFTDLWEAYNIDLDTFITDFIDFIDNDINNIETLLADTGTIIAYATSSNGDSWTLEPGVSLDKIGPGPWGSVTSPCVTYYSGAYEIYEMWYTKGTDDLSAQYLLNLLQSVYDPGEFPIGYASSSVGIELVAGWNLIGLPLTPSSIDISDVLSDIMSDVSIAWAFDATTQTWTYYIPGGPSPTLTEMMDGIGYWLDISSTTTLTISGDNPSTPYEIELEEGWNLIGLPVSPESTAIGDVLSDIISDIDTVWYFDATTQTWTYYIPGGPSPTLTEMTEGNGYWINMLSSSTLTIN